METIYLAGGCFWCTEAVFQNLVGVKEVVPGYMGGHVENPNYTEVCSGSTGHAEVIKILFDPAIISTSTILEIFFDTHDPTTINKQGNDTGTQYRSAIFYTNENMRKDAVCAIEKAQEKYPNDKIVTEINSSTAFYPAENYHQNYYQNNASAGYCKIVINPKLEKLKKKYNDKIKS